jgi:hypothetical protein
LLWLWFVSRVVSIAGLIESLETNKVGASFRVHNM